CPGGKSTRKGERLPFEENYTPRSRIGSFGFGVLYAASKYLRLLLILFRGEIFQQTAAREPFFCLRLDRRERDRPVPVNGVRKNLSRLSVGYSHALPVIYRNRCHQGDFPTRRQTFQGFSAIKYLNHSGTAAYDSNSNRHCPVPNRRRSSYSMPQKMFKKKC